MSISDLYTLKKQYETLKGDITSIVSYLNSSIGNLETPSLKIGEVYNIDNQAIDKNKLISIRADLNVKKSYLTDVVLVEIEQKIKSLTTEIEQAEEAERKRQEEQNKPPMTQTPGNNGNRSGGGGVSTN